MHGICEACEAESEVIVIDNGIGPYEFWGAKCVDSRPDAVSECCEAPILDEYTGQYVTVEDIKDEIECARADYEIDLAEDRKLFPDEYDW